MSEPRVHPSVLLAGVLLEDLIGVARQDLPTDHPVCDALSLMRSQSTPSSSRVSYCDGFSSWVSDEPVDDTHFYQGPSGLIHVVNSNDRNKVVDAGEELNKLVKDEMPDAVVRSRQHTHTLHRTRLGQKLSLV